MLEIIAASTVAAALTIVFKSHKSDSSRLIEPRPTIQTIGVQIICGDCSGNEDRPVKTYLSRDGLCAQCGGRSYILASHRFSHAQQIMMARLLEKKDSSDRFCLESVGSPQRPCTTQINAVTALGNWGPLS